MSAPPPMRSTAVIHAAGGLVWRGRDRAELAVVRRVRHGEEWTLPKGKLNEDESWEQAAVREVQEETGCVVQLGRFAGGQIYHVGERPKVVLYWHMLVLREGVFPPEEEVREVAWLTPAAARDRLTHESARRLVAQAPTTEPVEWPHA